MLPSEELALRALGYRKVYFSELHCKDHGEIRIATATEPRRRHPCPICNKACWCSRPLCQGYTKREPPYHENITGPAVIRRMMRAEYTVAAAVAEDKRRAAAVG
jgi:hypothetical protein